MQKKKRGYSFVFPLIGLAVFLGVLYLSLHKELNFSLSALKDALYRPFTQNRNNQVDLIGEEINKELESENKELKKITGISASLSDFKTIPATIIERNHSFWLEQMTINKGRRDGVDIGMAVVVGEGLVGKISSISEDTAVVKLITSTDHNNKVSVKFRYGETYQYKVLEIEGEEMVIKGLENDIEKVENVEVTTSGLSDIYPSGILIGTISTLESDKYGTSKKAKVESRVDFSSLRFVSVLSRENF